MENIHLHLAVATANTLFLERLLIFEDVTRLVFPKAPAPVDGFMTATDAPGLDLPIDLDAIRAAERP
jgi:L-alanine-DL-glutamate epimerase-like enolase superfamily enzyme